MACALPPLVVGSSKCLGPILAASGSKYVTLRASGGVSYQTVVNIQAACDIKAAMKSTLAVIGVAQKIMPNSRTHFDQEANAQMQWILNRYKTMYEDSGLVERPRVKCLNAWREFRLRTVESFLMIERADKTLRKNMNKLKAVEKVYLKSRRKVRLQQACSNTAQSKIKKPKSDLRAVAGKKKHALFKQWHDCVKAASKNLGVAGLPRKGTEFYGECKRLMEEKL